uniref:Uncharacterized protein n=1 Tax=Strigamia maritima TaxID=126957 RepID=T1JMB1_STRMM
HIVTCETITGEVYRGKLLRTHELLNDEYHDGRVVQLENIYIRGSKIRFLILPDMLKNAPMFKRTGNKNAIGTASQGKSAIF